MSSCWTLLICSVQHMVSVSHGFPSGDINHRVGRDSKRREEAVPFPLALLLLFFLFSLTSAIVLGFTVHLLWQAGEYHAQLLLPTAPHCPRSPRLMYNRIQMTTLDTGPGESHFSFPLPHLDPPRLCVCSCSRHCTCSACSPPLFASPSTRPLPRARHLDGHKAGPKGLWQLIHPQSLLPGHHLPRGAQEHHHLEQPAATVQAGAPKQWAPSPAQWAEPLSRRPYHGHR